MFRIVVKSLAAASLVAIVLPSASLAGDARATPAAPTFKKISIEAFTAARAKKTPMRVYDVNGQRTRERFGVIPGATQLSSAARYDVKASLPASLDKTLVFYCSSEACTASHTAANRALEAGYKEVYVLGAGILGWTKAGKPVEKPSPKS